ncbi:hypothetical protein OB919_00805 [Halobacteria archaeon AArc-curdl1]|uniref:Uncharacterized protein n=1 Tax=Natronosalvus hydrolyticus TaxID=2979988 RepID=A0AAP2Z508_9EURY|nr:hypothetical protein [Halobacteria archaeon AArc-curdl1]
MTIPLAAKNDRTDKYVGFWPAFDTVYCRLLPVIADPMWAITGKQLQ